MVSTCFEVAIVAIAATPPLTSRPMKIPRNRRALCRIVYTAGSLPIVHAIPAILHAWIRASEPRLELGGAPGDVGDGDRNPEHRGSSVAKAQAQQADPPATGSIVRADLDALDLRERCVDRPALRKPAAAVNGHALRGAIEACVAVDRERPARVRADEPCDERNRPLDE